MNNINTTIATVNHIPTSAEDIQVGDIFYRTNPYYGISVKFYQVVSRTKSFVTVKEMDTQETSNEYDRFTGTSVPTTKLKDQEYRFKISACKYTGEIGFNTGLGLRARAWDGTPKEYDHGC